jgi:hypothetical protein
MDDVELVSAIEDDVRDTTLTFCLQQLQGEHPREDYKELLVLVVIILGGTPP